MAKSAYIILTSASTNTGPFNLLSDADSYATPFETNLSRSTLIAGYTSSLVPDAANIIRVQSSGSCTNYIDLVIGNTTTTTTTSTTTTTTTAPTTTTSTTTTTTTAPYTAEINVFGEDDGTGNIIFTANVTSGTTADILAFTFDVEKYSNTGCSNPISPSCLGSVNLPAGSSSVSSGTLCSTGAALTLKVISLDVNTNTITTSPQNIVVGGNTYRITGYNVCGGL